ncbi:hypothetical protein WMF27_10915 [Sorangium sp. So ce281]|uniref:hypothetical protein n=1 Tax=unclassified Sorangium TaxID=2621164 RepID=UPI003F646D13
MLLDRSLLAVVRGREARQDPAWLAGLPEYINWWNLRGDAPYRTDADLRLPSDQPTPTADALPRGAILDVRAGLSAAGQSWEMPRHFFTWNGARWSRAPANAAGGPPTDPRLGNDAQRWERYEAAAVTAGQLLVISDHSFNDRAALLLGPGRGPAMPLSLPLDDESPWSLVQLAGTEAGEAYLCTHDALFRWGEGRWEEQDLPEGRIASCAGTADGTQWLVVTREVADAAPSLRRPELLHRPRGGAWSAVPLPGGAWPVRVAASGERLWINASAGETRSPFRFEVYSNAPVEVPLTLGEVQIPWWHDPEGRERDPPAVGDWPPGPATSACTSPVVYLGRSLTPALQSALRKHTETEGLPLVEVEGTASGKTSEVWSGPDEPRGLRYHPTRARVRGVAILPATASDGIRIAELLAPDLPDLPPRVVCAKPRIRS